MNRFEAGLIIEAQRRHRRRLLAYVFVVILAAVLVATFILFARGTAISVIPEEAAGTASLRVTNGWAVSLGESVYSVSAKTTIVVGSPGFHSATVELGPNERGTRVSITLRPLSGMLRVVARPAHDQTRWYVENEPVSTGGNLERELDPGLYRIEVINPYFEPRSLEADVVRGADTNLEVTLNPVQGTITVSSLPSQAQLYLDGVFVGDTPMEGVALLGGRHTLKLESKGHRSVVEELEVTNAASAIRRNYRLERLPAFLTVSVEPAGGVLLLNGSTVAQGQRLPIPSAESHALTYALEGYHLFRDSLVLTPGEERKVQIRLEPELGQVVVSSTPNATILVDGMEVGRTPTTLQLAAKTTTVEVRRSGYRSERRTLTPTSAHPMSVAVVLVPELKARLAEAPKAYKNSVGIDLKLFHGSAFSMGASRDELGQRANEFVRGIELKKPFYAALHEVTREAFSSFQGKTGVNDPKKPATSLSWEDAAKFSNWLSDKEGLEPFYRFSPAGGYAGINATADGYRLLTEAEWEWLARKAGRPTRTVFPWGDSSTIPAAAGNIADESAKGKVRFFVPNYQDSFAETAPVGSFSPEQSGLYDLTGNVSEWVHDVYSVVPPATNQVEVDPLGAPRGTTHVVKGSSWMSGTRTTLRAAYREGAAQGRPDVGFRIGRYLYGGE